MTFLTWEQAVDLAEAHTELICLAVDSGMRWSELIGLRRARVDVQRGKVRVTEQLIRLKTKEWIRKEPKTPASLRSITVSPVTAELLKSHVERYSMAGPDGLVFPNNAGQPVAFLSFWNNHFTPSLERASLACRFHDLRHTSVALVIAEGAHRAGALDAIGGSLDAGTLVTNKACSAVQARLPTCQARRTPTWIPSPSHCMGNSSNRSTTH